jgi:hypothetical protein
VCCLQLLLLLPLLLPFLQADQRCACHRCDCCVVGASSASWRHGQLSTASSTGQAAVHRRLRQHSQGEGEGVPNHCLAGTAAAAAAAG